eukprot:scaffold96803_cov62-Phaeocystis_antarctica.AAC.2
MRADESARWRHHRKYVADLVTSGQLEVGRRPVADKAHLQTGRGVAAAGSKYAPTTSAPPLPSSVSSSAAAGRW